jgi:membrane-associated protease RseP (regulator of RpoE activity)
MIGGLIIVFGIISMVMIHEAGHFLAAKAVGMKATEFFFGFGPRVWSMRRGETEYGIKAIPLGGYVRVVGMNPYEEVAPEDEGRAYQDKPFWAKSVVVLAGVASHFVVAFLIFYVVHSAVGIGVRTTTIHTVQATLTDGTTTPAAIAGLEPGDKILSLDGVATPGWADLVDAISARPGETVSLSVNRGGAFYSITATLASEKDSSGTAKGFLGIEPGTTRLRANPIAGLARAGGSVGSAVIMSAEGLWRLVTGLPSLVGNVFSGNAGAIGDNRPASPIGLVRIGAETQAYGLGFTLELVAVVNIFVAIFNVVPIYPLDGGHFTVALYEKLRGRRVDPRKLAPVAAAVVALMVLLGGLAIFLDLVAPFRVQ